MGIVYAYEKDFWLPGRVPGWKYLTSDCWQVEERYFVSFINEWRLSVQRIAKTNARLFAADAGIAIAGAWTRSTD